MRPQPFGLARTATMLSWTVLLTALLAGRYASALQPSTSKGALGGEGLSSFRRRILASSSGTLLLANVTGQCTVGNEEGYVSCVTLGSFNVTGNALQIGLSGDGCSEPTSTLTISTDGTLRTKHSATLRKERYMHSLGFLTATIWLQLCVNQAGLVQAKPHRERTRPRGSPTRSRQAMATSISTSA